MRPGPERAARALALIALLLAVFCVAAALAWRREHARAECWRDAAEQDEGAQEDCDAIPIWPRLQPDRARG